MQPNSNNVTIKPIRVRSTNIAIITSEKNIVTNFDILTSGPYVANTGKSTFSIRPCVANPICIHYSPRPYVAGIGIYIFSSCPYMANPICIQYSKVL